MLCASTLDVASGEIHGRHVGSNAGLLCVLILPIVRLVPAIRPSVGDDGPRAAALATLVGILGTVLSQAL